MAAAGLFRFSDHCQAGLAAKLFGCFGCLYFSIVAPC